MAEFGWTEEYVLDELDGAKGWAYFNWSLVREAAANEVALVIDGDGYIQQEKKRIQKQQRDGK